MNTLLNNIGNTPIISLKRLFPHRRVFLKLEGQNPSGSVKDRVAEFLVTRAIERRTLRPGMRILEATSGNMGIALAMIGAVRGIGVTIVMSAGMSRERQQMIRALGADLILTPAAQGTTGARQKVRALQKMHPDKFWFADQFGNPDNVKAHAQSLAPEILQQVPAVQTIVAGVGTSGTVGGLVYFFQKHAPGVQIVGVLPPEGFGLQGLQHPDRDFRPAIWDPKSVEIFETTQKAAFSAVKQVAQKEGLLLGPSSGAMLSAILSRKFLEPIVGISADRVEKYLSTDFLE
ncbi:MAG: cysteine synthase family protein [Candidatus Gracilibacteria bacterium]|nr:cysteine synthase family protein [Candidatus Gracilibacteria bacterium]